MGSFFVAQNRDIEEAEVTALPLLLWLYAIGTQITHKTPSTVFPKIRKFRSTSLDVSSVFRYNNKNMELVYNPEEVFSR